MQEICSYGSVGEPVGNHRLYPEGFPSFRRLVRQPTRRHHARRTSQSRRD